jgi:RNA polymerase sigma-70 factor, ECF subfamily
MTRARTAFVLGTGSSLPARGTPQPDNVPRLGVVPALPASDMAPSELEFDWVFRRYSSYVAAVAHRLLGRDDEVDDTVQEVFLAAVRGLPQIRDPGAVKAWLARIAVRVARRKLRVRRMRAFLGSVDATDYHNVADATASPEERALVQRVYRVLDTLPANQRIAWTLRHIEGEQLEAVAALSGCSLATAKRWISQAAQTLEETFADE